MDILSKTDLEQLLQEKNFGALTPPERSFVLENMEQKEYDRLHTLLTRSRMVLKNAPLPDPALRQNLLAAFRSQGFSQKKERVGSRGLLVRALSHRIPAWQAAAAVAALLGLFFWWKNDSRSTMQPETVYVHRTDTVYKEATAIPARMDSASHLPPARLNVKPRPAKTAAVTALVTADSAARRTRFPSLPDTLPGFQMKWKPARGRPVSDMQDLSQFWGEVH